MQRTRWLAGLAFVLIAAGALLQWRRSSASPGFSCPPESIRWVDAGRGEGGFAACVGPDAGAPLPPAWARTLGQKLNLNALSEADLAAVPGIGPKLARTLVTARAARRRFSTWEEVDTVSGVGPAKLQLIQNTCVLGP